MAVRARAFIFAGCVVLAVLGLALGAESQKETFLHPETLADVGLQDASGNLVTLTASLPALAVAVAAGMISKQAPLRRTAPIGGCFVSTYFLVWLVQSSWPNYDALEQLRSARFSITPLITNGDAVASVYLGPLAILLAFGMTLWASLRALVPRPATPASPEGLVARFAGAYLLGAPFLIILIAGNVRLLVALPDGQQALAPYLLVFPLAALAALGLLITGAVKGWHIGAFARNGRMAEPLRDAWTSLRLAEWILAGVLGGLALLATVLGAIDDGLLQAGRTFSVTTRGHVQAQILLLFPLLPWLTMDSHVARAVEAGGSKHTMDVGTHPTIIGSWAALGIGAAGALLATWTFGGSLWPWAMVLAPAALYGWIRLPPEHSLWPAMLLAVVLWGMGNHLEGAFELTADTALTFSDPPGLLALSRVLAVVVVAVAVSRAARAEACGEGARMPLIAAWSVSVALGATVALVLFLELPFTAWIATGAQGEYVGIGSVVASQDAAVRAALHIIAAASGAGAGLFVARIHRPDWFGRTAPPLPAVDASVA